MHLIPARAIEIPLHCRCPQVSIDLSSIRIELIILDPSPREGEKMGYLPKEKLVSTPSLGLKSKQWLGSL